MLKGNGCMQTSAAGDVLNLEARSAFPSAADFRAAYGSAASVGSPQELKSQYGSGDSSAERLKLTWVRRAACRCTWLAGVLM
jgi:hypothetical protein